MPTGTSPTDAPARRRRDPERRERILLAAARLAASRGFHTVGMAEIGAEAGIVGSGVYRHFDSKDAILLALLDRGMSRLEDGAAAVLARGGSDHDDAVRTGQGPHRGGRRGAPRGDGRLPPRGAHAARGGPPVAAPPPAPLRRGLGARARPAAPRPGRRRAAAWPCTRPSGRSSRRCSTAAGSRPSGSANCSTRSPTPASASSRTSESRMTYPLSLWAESRHSVPRQRSGKGAQQR